MSRSVKIATLFFCIIPLLAGCEKLDINKNCLNSLSSCFKPDKTAPSVANSLPLPNSGSTNVSLLTAIQITFSEDMKDIANASRYQLSGNGATGLSISSVDELSGKSAQVNLAGQVSNGQIVLTFPTLTDFGNNSMIAGSSVTLTGNVNIGVVFEDASQTYYTSNIAAAGQPTRITAAVIHWHHTYDKNPNNSYEIKIGGSNCTDPAALTVSGVSSPTGFIAANTTVTTTLNASNTTVFASGDNDYIIRVCVTNAEMNKMSDNDYVTVVRDSTAPSIVFDIGGGNYGTVQSVNFSCTDHCDRIAYAALSGTAPGVPTGPSAFGSGGTTSDILISGPWPTPHDADPWTTNIKLIAYDKAGNQSTATPAAIAYKIDTNIPVITFGSPASTHDYISSTGFTSTTFNWSSNKTGNYLICRNGTGCGTAPTPSCAGGGSAIGSVTAYNTIGASVNSIIGAGAPLAAGNNTIHICFATASQMGDATRVVIVDNSAPTLVSLTPGDNTSSISPNTILQVSFADSGNSGLNPDTVTTNEGVASCTGSVQLSSDDFTTCIALKKPTYVSNLFSISQPTGARLNKTVHKIRVTSAVKDFAGNSYAGTIQANGFTVSGLLRQYLFTSGGLTDDAGSGNNLSIGGGFAGGLASSQVTGVDGDAAGAYRFNGVGDYLTAVDTGLPMGNSARTICTWVNPAINKDGFLFDYGSPGTTQSSFLLLRAHQIVFGSLGSDTSQNLAANFDLPLNTWSHLCGVLDASGNVTLYVNGVIPPGGGPSPRAFGTQPAQMNIGAQANGAFRFNGRLDDVRIYIGALTAGDIRQMAIQVPNGLLAYYSFSDAASGTAIDYSGNGHTGIRNGAPLPTITTDRFGVTGAYTFGGPSQYINAPDTGLPSGNAPRTMCSWIRPTTLPGSGQIRVAARYGTPGTGQETYIGLHNNSGQQTVIFSSGNDHLIAPYPVATATWINLCGSYDGSTAKIYANGQLLASAAKAWNTVLLGNNGILIGQRDLTGTYVFPGAIDDVRIYNRVLTDNEILALSSQLGIGLLRQYSFTGGTTTDDTGSGNSLNLSATGSNPLNVNGFDGQTNSAYSFTPASRYLVGNDTGLPMGTAARTMCAWMRPTPLPASGQFSIAAMYGLNATQQANYIGVYNDGLQQNAIYSGWSDHVLSPYTQAAGSWVHMCGTFDNTDARLYVNGTLLLTQAKPGWNTASGGATGFYVGTGDGSGLFPFQGDVDNVRVYNRVLSVAEIQELQGY